MDPVSELDVVGPVPVVALVLLAALAWAVVVRRRSRVRRRPARALGARARAVGVLGVSLALLATTAATADAVNADFSYAPHLGDVTGLAVGSGLWSRLGPDDLGDPASARRHPSGGVLPFAVPGQAAGLGAGDALVWLPPQYLAQPTARFPVVYLFHGSPGIPADWLRGGGADVTGAALAAEGYPAIIVMPRMSRGWLDDPECVDGVQEKVETYFWSDVVPSVDAAFRTVPGRDGRVLAGMSAGGYCALNLGLKHRDQVATVLDLSGLTAPTRRGGLAALYGQRPDLAARAAQDTPSAYAARLPADPPTRVWLDTGTSDGTVRPGMLALAPVLRARGLSVVLHERPGAHTFRVWRPALRESLAWALRGGAAAPAQPPRGQPAASGAPALR